jgi:hypothetical protein
LDAPDIRGYALSLAPYNTALVVGVGRRLSVDSNQGHDVGGLESEQEQVPGVQVGVARGLGRSLGRVFQYVFRVLCWALEQVAGAQGLEPFWVQAYQLDPESPGWAQACRLVLDGHGWAQAGTKAAVPHVCIFVSFQQVDSVAPVALVRPAEVLLEEENFSP